MQGVHAYTRQQDATRRDPERHRRATPRRRVLAGLRAGEIRGLHWSSVDLTRRLITVERSEYKGQYTSPKYDRIRTVPTTKRLTSAIRALRRNGSKLVLPRYDDVPLTPHFCRYWLAKAAAGAELTVHGPHTLRRSFCSHLAMRGAAVSVIQKLAGHRSLVTTQQ